MPNESGRDPEEEARIVYRSNYLAGLGHTLQFIADFLRSIWRWLTGEQAMYYARRGLETRRQSERFQQLEPGRPLRSAIVQDRTASGAYRLDVPIKIDRPQGGTIFRTVRLTVYDYESKEDILKRLQRKIEQWEGRYPGSQGAALMNNALVY